jgi:hypothetical protein
MAHLSGWALLLTLGTVLVAGFGAVGGERRDVAPCESFSCYVIGEYQGEIKRDVEILLFTVKNNNREVMHFVRPKNADVDNVEKGDRVVAVYKSHKEKNILSALHRVPTTDPGRGSKDEPIAVSELSPKESMLIAEEIRQYNKDEEGTHGASGGFVGKLTIYASAKGTVTTVRRLKSDASSYLYHFYIDPLPAYEVKSEGGFLIDLATSVEVDVRRNSCVEVFFKMFENGDKRAVAVFPCH